MQRHFYLTNDCKSFFECKTVTFRCSLESENGNGKNKIYDCKSDRKNNQSYCFFYIKRWPADQGFSTCGTLVTAVLQYRYLTYLALCNQYGHYLHGCQLERKFSINTRNGAQKKKVKNRCCTWCTWKKTILSKISRLKCSINQFTFCLKNNT